MKNGTDHEEILFFFMVKNEIGVVSKFVFALNQEIEKEMELREFVLP